ncbi:DUF6069 family protein [Actinoplanes rectilineatus]|uniref:DUF6069 family protein n=1 Tax=Actinoplanes rectilineatus TaxID=113571 RepID=UPI000ACA4826|nr:DUF6069 family protein [Actinoplanes rectilineatus]
MTNEPRQSSDTTTRPATRATVRRSRRALSVVAGAGGALLLWTVDVVGTGTDLTVRQGDDVREVGPAAVVLTALLAGLAAWALLALLENRLRRPARAFRLIAVTMLLLCLVGPFAATTTGGCLALIAMHVTVGAALIFGLPGQRRCRRASSARQKPQRSAASPPTSASQVGARGAGSPGLHGDTLVSLPTVEPAPGQARPRSDQGPARPRSSPPAVEPTREQGPAENRPEGLRRRTGEGNDAESPSRLDHRGSGDQGRISLSRTATLRPVVPQLGIRLGKPERDVPVDSPTADFHSATADFHRVTRTRWTTTWMCLFLRVASKEER